MNFSKLELQFLLFFLLVFAAIRVYSQVELPIAAAVLVSQQFNFTRQAILAIGLITITLAALTLGIRWVRDTFFK